MRFARDPASAQRCGAIELGAGSGCSGGAEWNVARRLRFIGSSTGLSEAPRRHLDSFCDTLILVCETWALLRDTLPRDHDPLTLTCDKSTSPRDTLPLPHGYRTRPRDILPRLRVIRPRFANPPPCDATSVTGFRDPERANGPSRPAIAISCGRFGGFVHGMWMLRLGIAAFGADNAACRSETPEEADVGGQCSKPTPSEAGYAPPRPSHNRIKLSGALPPSGTLVMVHVNARTALPWPMRLAADRPGIVGVPIIFLSLTRPGAGVESALNSGSGDLR